MPVRAERNMSQIYFEPSFAEFDQITRQVDPRSPFGQFAEAQRFLPERRTGKIELIGKRPAAARNLENKTALPGQIGKRISLRRAVRRKSEDLILPFDV